MITDMTKGSPFKILWSFTYPMLISMIFQQLYNIADSVVAGKFVGPDALAAVGASYPITMVFIAIATGFSMGCSVIVAQIFGAKDYTRLKTAVSTALISGFSLSCLLTILGAIFCNPMMTLLNTPNNVFADAALYLRVYIWGMAFLFMYNAANAVFTALGDSKTPLILLICSSISNIFLDILFVTAFQMGVAGVAWATFLAQGVSSVFAVLFLLKRLRSIQSPETPKVFDKKMLWNMSRVAIPSILQQSFVSVGQLFVQGLVNSYGSVVIAGFSAGFKVNTFALMCFNTMSSAISNFTSQNMGAGNVPRVLQGFKSSLGITLGISAVIALAYFFFAGPIISVFVDTGTGADVIAVGAEYVRIIAPFYVIVSIKIVVDGVLRGAGAMGSFMVSTFADLLLRVVFAFILSATALGRMGIWWATPVGWIPGTAIAVFFFLRGKWKSVHLVDAPSLSS